MSLKQEIETWVNALEFYDKQDYDTALKSFDGIADTSKILFNCGVIHATLGEHDKAVEAYQKAIALDKYLAIAYFQQGVSNFLVGDFEEALANFNDTLLYLRGNRFIDYEQLGLKFKLYSCEALFNRGLCYIYLQARENGMNDLIYAAKEKETPDHDVIDEAIKENAEGYTVFSIPVGVVYRPNASKVKNLKTKDYLGKARLIASTDKNNQHTNFSGVEIKNKEITAASSGADHREPEKVSFAAANLVRTDLPTSRVRQQSEPPMNRSVFPPTPPPEEARGYAPSTARLPPPSIAPSDSVSLTSRANSIRGGVAPYRVPGRQQIQMQPTLPEEEVPAPVMAAAPPGPNTLPATAFNPNSMQGGAGDMMSPMPPPDALRVQQRSRLGNIRTGSEPPRMREDSTAISPRSRANIPRQRLYGELSDDPHDADTEELNDEANDSLYDLYHDTASRNPYARSNVGRERSLNQRPPNDPRRDRSTSRRPQQQQQAQQGINRSDSMYPEDIDAPPSGHSSLEDFEMLNPTQHGRNVPAALQTGHRRNQSDGPPGRAPSSHSRTNSYAAPVTNIYMAYGNQPDVKSFRVKIHYNDESRYLMVTANTAFDDFERKAKEKLKLQGAIKIKMRDEEDPEAMITVGDADDWKMALEVSKKEARGKGEEMGRLEVWLADA